jgi:hypothetical protein
MVITLHAHCYCCGLAATGATTRTAEREFREPTHLADDAPEALLAALEAVRVAEPSLIAETLHELKLGSPTSWRADLRQLDASEVAEMMAVMQQGGVALGLGRIFALYCRPSTSLQIHDHIQYFYF